jgi:hypothetical protein
MECTGLVLSSCCLAGAGMERFRSSLGLAACAAGEQDEPIQLEREVHTIGDPTLIGAKYWPDLAELRQDPRFQEILRSRGWT